jgi:hypothetical membrane protein
MTSRLLDVYCSFGLAGCAVILAAIGIASAFYLGRQKERYSILNHFISELGEVGVSPKARVFNGGLILGGLTLLPFVVGLGLSLGGPWGMLALVVGLGMAGGCIAVGLFPMNNLAAHVVAAQSFFRLGLGTVLLFGIATFAQPAEKIVVPLATNVLSGLAVLAYAGLLGLAGRQSIRGKTLDEVMNTAALVDRPRFWLLPVLEWSILITTLLWVLAVVLTASH